MKVVTFLKHVFIPHEGNNYKPHFFRELSVAILFASSIFLLGFSAGSSYLLHKTVLGASVAASVLIDLANESRLAYNEAPLIRSDLLDRAAQLKGEDMVTKDYFAHTSPEGVTPWHWFKEVGYLFKYAGENLAINFTDSHDVQDAWLASPLHRANLLDVKFREIGIATVEGTYKNNPTTFVVQMFGTPAQATTDSTQSEIVTVQPQTTSEGRTLPNTELARSGEVKGEVTVLAPPTTSVSSSLIEVASTSEIAIVKNTDAVETMQHDAQIAPTYSTWYGRLLFGGPRYVDMVYKTLMVVITFALLTMLFIEFKKQHYKHAVYGVFLLVALALLVFINKGFFF